MATIRQKKLAKNIVLNAQEKRWNSLKDLLLISGYSKSTSSKDQVAIIQHKGVQESLVKLGFNEVAAQAVVSEILLLGEESNRLRASDMIFKTFGTYAPEKSISLHGDIATLIDKLNKYEETPQNNPSH